jgi:hypothetical protein
MKKLLPGEDRLGTQGTIYRDRQGHAITKIYWEYQRKWFFRELYWLLKLQDCPYTPKILSYDEKTHSITMEYVGPDLLDLSNPEKEIPGDWNVQVSRIYEALREVGCSHNDITPHNMTLYNGQLYLIDFSLATSINEKPEQVFGARTLKYLGQFFKPEIGVFDDKFALHDCIQYILKTGRWALISEDTGKPYTELQTVVIWGKSSRAILKKVKDFINKDHAVVGVHPFVWSEENKVSNLSRFYSTFLGKGSNKYKLSDLHKSDELILLTYTVNNPTIIKTESNKRVNQSAWRVKTSTRDLYGYKIHASNDRYEAERDLNLFFGLNSKEYLEKYKNEPLFGEEETVEKRDLMGAHGWTDVFEMLKVLEPTPYCVLRNFDDFPRLDEEHPDIDLLVSNREEAALLLNAVKVHDTPRVQYKTTINGSVVYLDLREVGDGYFDCKWQTRLLDDRRFCTDKKFFIPSETNHFFSLLYHAFVHKGKLSSEYRAKLKQLARTGNVKGVCLVHSDWIYTDNEALKELLGTYMKHNVYQIVQPEDPTVGFFRLDYISST